MDYYEIRSITDAYFSRLEEAKKLSPKALKQRIDSGDFIDVNAERANLKGETLSRGKFARAFFKDANLSGADLRNSKGRDATFINANLENAKLTGSDFPNANFRGARMKNADLSGCDLEDAIFGPADLTGADLSSTNLRNAYLVGTKLAGADLTNANLDGAKYDEAEIKKAKTNSRTKLNEASRRTGYDIYHKTYSGALTHAINYVFDNMGLEVDEVDYYTKVATGPRKPSSGKTNSFIIDLVDVRSGKPSRKKLHMQIYNMDNKGYELNMYVS